MTYYTGGNIDVTSEEVAGLSQSDIDILSYGSKLEFMSWYTYPGTICEPSGSKSSICKGVES